MDARITPEFLSDFSLTGHVHLPTRDFSDLHLPALPELPQLPLFPFQRDYTTIQCERQLDAYNKALDTLLKIAQLQARMTNPTQGQASHATSAVQKKRGVKRAKANTGFEEM